MDRFRALIKSIRRHRSSSILIGVATIGAMLFFQFMRARSEGTLTKPLERGKIVESVYGIGTVMANHSYQIRLGVISTINDLYVKEGDSVTKGQRLAEIDRVTFRAPFAGIVTLLPFKVGENVFTNVSILTLSDLLDRYLVVSMEQQAALRVQRGQKAKMSFDTIREQNYDGIVYSVYSNEGNFLARIDISNLPASILPGMTADVAISTRERNEVLLIPIAALEQGNIAWVKRGQSFPRKVEVKLGIIDNAMAEVASGDLHEGDRLLIRKEIKR